MKKPLIVSSILALFFVAIFLGLPIPASADGPIGTGGGQKGLTFNTAGQSLGVVVNEYGKIKLSIDAMGTAANQGDIHVDKPSGGKVRKAYLLSATTGFTNYELANGDVKVNGNDVSWAKKIPNSIESFNYWADVTNIVKPTIDAASAGITAIQITEQNSNAIDGEILAVIFDDPNQTTNNAVILYFGAQNIAGDAFTINTGSPINTNDSNLKLNFSLGISYGCQGECGSGAQYSQVDVNGQRLTTSAGGEDDGESTNGALITVGGIGDSDDNPPDPNALPVSPRSDDELYNLKPFVKNNDTTIQINTLNPSNDDNIFFAALQLSSNSTIQTIDVDITLAGNPTTAEEQAPYGNIIKYFADAVYEMSNGMNKLGSVTFYSNGTNSNDADVVWAAKGWPVSEVAGYGINGMHISMYDVFRDGSGKGFDYNFLEDDKHQKMGGYALGHEFGHLYYSLYDEYECVESYTSCDEFEKYIYMPHSSDKPVTNSVMNNTWKVQSLFGDDNNWLNFSVAKNTSGNTAQYRVYGASGWDTLARPVSSDPKTPVWAAIPVRLYHSELASVKPGQNQDSHIDLPGTARSELSIGWATDGIIYASPKSMKSLASTTTIPYMAELNSMLGQNISYPDPIILQTFVHQDLKITDLNVTGNITSPDGLLQAVTFADDGISPDVLKGDGIYSAILNYSVSGLYTIQANFDNHALNGKLVAYGSQMSTDSNGDSVPYPDPQPVTDDFALSQSLLVSISNVVLDGHGNTPDLATHVSSDNVTVSGKIDYSGDADVFKIITLPNGMTFIRVTNLAFGITPHVRVFGADGQSILYELDLPSAGGYINTALASVAPGTTAYIEVTDKLGNFGGVFGFSAGNQLYSDDFGPIITSIIRADPNPTSAASVDFTVTFSESVTGVDTNDFALTQTGTLTGAFVTNVSGGPGSYTVTVNTGTGSGELRLDLPVGATITNLAGIPLAGLPYTIGESYTIDSTAPSMISLQRSDPDISGEVNLDLVLSVAGIEPGVSGADVYVSYDPAFVAPPSAPGVRTAEALPDFFGSANVSINELLPAAQCPGGVSPCIHLVLAGPPQSTQTGIAARYHFRGVAEGTACFAVLQSTLVNADGYPVEHAGVPQECVPVELSATASGVVNRQGIVVAAGAGAAGNGPVCSSVTAIANETFGPTHTDAGGGYSFINLPVGTYLFRAAYPGYLTSEKNGVNVSTNVPAVDAGATTLRGGDVNGDNAINILDVATILSKFGLSGVAVRSASADCSGPDEAFDINDDGLINVSDLAITAGNWGKVGPTAWQP